MYNNNPKIKLSEERMDNIHKGNVELKVYCGSLIMREVFPSVNQINDLEPKDMEMVLRELGEIQMYMDRNCVLFSERHTHNTIQDWKKGGEMWKNNTPKEIDFDIKRWVEKYDYFEWIFNNHREIHTAIGSYFEYIT